jgi:thioredoxin 1
LIRTTFRVLPALALLLLLPACSSSRIDAVRDAEFQVKVLESDLPVLVDFWATWCGPCRIMAPVLDELSADLKGRVRVLKMDVDRNPQTPPRYGVQAIPTLILFKDGRMIRQFVGVIARDDLRAQVEEALARAAKPDVIVTLTADNFEQEVLRSRVPVLVDFWAVWCGPCRILAPVVEDISWEYEGRLKVGKVNLDENKDLARKYRVRAIPMVLLFDGGRIIRQWEGVRPREEYVNAVERVAPAASVKTPEPSR